MSTPSAFENFFLGQLDKLQIVGIGLLARFRASRTTSDVAKPSSALQRLLNNKKLVGGVCLATLLFGYTQYTSSKTTKRDGESSDDKNLPKKRRGISKEFLLQIIPLLKICIPGWRSKEMLILIFHTAFLISRTFISIYVASLDGAIVRSLVDRNGKKFIYLLCIWFAVAVPATSVNSMIKYMESKLALAFRTRLTNYTYKIYMTDETYYRVGNLDSRLTNADQCLTEDVSKFSAQLAHLHSQLSKPILDVVLFAGQLFRLAQNNKSTGSGRFTAAIAICVISLTAKVLQLVQPPFGKMAAQQQALEGELRFVHSRLITNAEEVSFYRGHKIEAEGLRSKYTALVKHVNKIFKSRIIYGMLEGFFMKYVWSAAGLSIIAIPAFFYDPNRELRTSEVVSNRTQDYVTAKMLLTSVAEAIERIMLAFKEVNELAGYTSRVADMIKVFNDVRYQKYEKIMVRNPDQAEGSTLTERLALSKGVDIESPYVKFEKVPIISPNGDVLVSALSFEAQPGMHMLITGPNGCGKSSMFRILGGLWPVAGGVVHKPNIRDMFYIPQRPYLSMGTLRDQVIYPDTVEDMRAKGKTDQDLIDILSWVNLLHILEREGGWDATSEWKDVLSGGEKQRIGMARLFYHKPRFAILDECTSAVSIDVEGKMYQHAIDEGITLLTVTHRPSLWKYHNHLLQFDGEGGVKFSDLNATERMSLKEEKSKLESQLSGVSKMTERLRELCGLLGEDSVHIVRTKSKEVKKDAPPPIPGDASEEDE
eukprot:TRINITY_DN1809_c0_g1_i1.p1 TRINITY_DN1809_c0_g1~~TRINITY_DN1809_c0_g1_i1.p1  ORF type:complete len:764 (+),score=232.80 TRINITY_DN1809_c0_g1_i1:79-2370(+)